MNWLIAVCFSSASRRASSARASHTLAANCSQKTVNMTFATTSSAVKTASSRHGSTSPSSELSRTIG